MKIALWGIGGIIAIIVVVMGVVTYWSTSVKVDFKDPITAGNLKETFVADCIGLYKQRASKHGKAVADDQLGKLDQACTCWRDGAMPALAKREPMTAVQLGSVLTNDSELNTIAQSCFTQNGIKEP